jgi:mRNA interferase HicA
MKKRDLEKQLKALGWYFSRHGKKHDVWTDGAGDETTIPRHTEINELTAQGILAHARKEKK